MNAHSLLLDASDVRAVVSRVGRDALMDALIARLTEAIRALRSGRRPGPAAQRRALPAAGMGPAGMDAGALRRRGNDGRSSWGITRPIPSGDGLPTVISTICVFDTQQRAPDGRWSMARSSRRCVRERRRQSRAACWRCRESRTLGVIGCGAQAVTQVHALSRVFPIERIVAYDISDEVAANAARPRRVSRCAGRRSSARESLVDLDRGSGHSLHLHVGRTRRGPVFSDAPHKPHLHVNAVGSDFPGKFELPVELLRRSLVCPDFCEQAIAKASASSSMPGGDRSRSRDAGSERRNTYARPRDVSDGLRLDGVGARGSRRGGDDVRLRQELGVRPLRCARVSSVGSEGSVLAARRRRAMAAAGALSADPPRKSRCG